MKTWHDLWKYLCEHGANAYDISQYYVENPNRVASAFWNGILTALEASGTITTEEANSIWNEIAERWAD